MIALAIAVCALNIFIGVYLNNVFAALGWLSAMTLLFAYGFSK